MQTAPTTLPLSRLTPKTAANARPETDDGLEELAASIAAKGIIQPLVVRPASKGDSYEVIDGRRRFRALQRLVKAKRMKKDDAVPVLVRNEDDGEALETSLMANTVRLPMHPIDQHEVFARLVGEGLDAGGIAARFGLKQRTVEQHLALGRLAPEIRQAWRDDKVSAETAQAFTMLEPARQVPLYNELMSSNHGHVSAWTVRKHAAGEKPRSVLYATLRLRSSLGEGPMRVQTQGMAQQRYEPRDGEETFAGLLAVAPSSVAVLVSDLAPLLAEALDLRAFSAGADREDDQALVQALNGASYLEAVRDLFDPADFFGRAPKDVALAAIEDMRATKALQQVTQSATELAKMKKGDVAHVATLAAKRCGWLPELLRHSAYALSIPIPPAAKPAPARRCGKMAAAEQDGD